jgi:hypothetical protein
VATKVVSPSIGKSEELEEIGRQPHALPLFYTNTNYYLYFVNKKPEQIRLFITYSKLNNY